MERLNYHHLLYFWTAAREGGINRAAERLSLTQPSVSAQIRQLEVAVGTALFRREGRSVALTEAGRMVFRYADELFTIGRELQQALRGVPGRPAQFSAGVIDAVPKLIAARLLRAAAAGPPPSRLVCREGSMDSLLADLATHAIDVVIADAPAPSHLRVRAFSHLLGESEVAFFASPHAAARLRGRFPASLHGTPVALPSAGSTLRRSLDAWFEAVSVTPRIDAEFDDPALMKAVASTSGLCFPAPAVIARDVRRAYGVRMIGRVPNARERFYAISVERRVTHPAVAALARAARDRLLD